MSVSEIKCITVVVLFSPPPKPMSYNNNNISTLTFLNGVSDYTDTVHLLKVKAEHSYVTPILVHRHIIIK